MFDEQPDAFGSFLVRASLGDGRFGPVYLAYDRDGNRPVVVRTFTLPLDASDRGRLLDALRWLCDMELDHPALGRPLATGLRDERPFLVHSYLQGLPLDEFLRERVPQTPSEIVPRVTQLASAIDFAAAEGIHHGAIRSRDVILGRERSGLAGVGLVQALAMADLQVQTRGGYDRPKRQADDPPSRSDDIYALGVVALQLLLGRPVAAPPYAEVLAELAQTVRPVVGAAVAADDRDRPATALEFAAALQRAVGVPPESGILAFHSETDEAGLAETNPRPGSQLDFDLDEGAKPVSGDVVLVNSASAGGSGEPDVVMGEPAPVGEPVGLASVPLSPPQASRLDLMMIPDHHDRTGERAHSPAARAAASDWMDFARQPDAAAVVVDRFDDEPSDRFVHDGHGVRPLAPSEPGKRPSRAPVWVAVVAAVAAIGIVGGFAGGYLAGQLSEPVPFPRTAARPGTQGPVPGNQESDISDQGARGDAPPLERAEARDADALSWGALPGGPTVIAPEPLRGVDEPEREIRMPQTAVPVAPGPAAASDAPLAAASPSESNAPDARANSPAGASLSVRPPPAVEQGPPPGRVLVRSTPAGAQVWVNGVSRGTTPLAVRELALTGHTITVTHPAYAARQERVTLTAAIPAQSIDFDLDRPGATTTPAAASVTGALYIESRPSGAQVFVNGRLIGNTPFLLSNVSAGSHVVQLDLPGYRRWSTSIHVALGERAHVAASLEP